MQKIAAACNECRFFCIYIEVRIKKRMKKLVNILMVLCLAAGLSSCTAGKADIAGRESLPGESDYKMEGERGDAPGEGYDETSDGDIGEGQDYPNTQAGLVTAGEWCDLDNWDFWGNLITGESYQEMSEYWGFWTNNRIAVEVTDKNGKPIAGVKVAIERSGADIWNAITDNLGRAECWLGMFQKEEYVASRDGLTLVVDGQAIEGSPKVVPWDCANGVNVNKVVMESARSAAEKADIAFIVDATGSMADEIDFLKQDLLDILTKVNAKQGSVAFRTAAVFYRDEGDEYLTRYNNFSADFATTTRFISEQFADGGGDYPEAVHSALDCGLQNLSWDRDAKTRIAFLLLDAPAHHNDKVINSLHQLIENYASAGIKIIPIAASGVDKNTEFMLRFFAIATNGTYVFITNHSGIGNDHIEASVGDFEVELLNELMIRLIEKYTN